MRGPQYWLIMLKLNDMKSSILIALLFSTVAFANAQHEPELSLSGESLEDFELARWLYHQTRSEEADVLFKDLLRNEPDFALGYAYSAMLDYLLFRNPTVNIERVEKATFTNNYERYISIALVHFVNGQLDSAAILLKNCLKLFPDDRYANHLLGYTQIDNDQIEEGLGVLLDIIMKTPEYFPAWNHIGYAYLRTDRQEIAIECFEKFIQGNPLNPSAYDSMADGLEKWGKPDEALAYLYRGTLIYPDFAYGWMHLGHLHKKLGETELARLCYQKALDHAEGIYGLDFIDSIRAYIQSL
jgi:tetratricopeptide (TPR) repeat protein